MRTFLLRFTLQQRLEGLVTVSTLLVLLFSGYLLVTSWRTAGESRSVARLSRLAVATSAAVHELQKERGRSSGFLGSGGSQFAAELERQRVDADAALTALDAAVREAGAADEHIRQALDAAATERRQLATMRQRVGALQVQGSEAIRFYSTLIAAYLSSVDQMALVPSEGTLVRQLVAYANFLQAKENAGLERAALSNAFGADRFTPELYRSFAGVVSAEQTRIALFRTHADPAHVQELDRVVAGPEVAQVAAWRALAFERASTGGFGVASGDWFAAATRRIDLMKAVEDSLSRDIVAAAAAAGTRADRMMMAVAGMTVLSLLFGIGGAILVGRMTSRALSAVAAELGQSAEQVVSAARQVAASAQGLAQGATEQAAALEETSASMEEMASMTHRNSDHAADAARLVVGMAQQVALSNTALTHMVGSMDAIKESSARVGHIIKTIDEIAFQTNILALNAAVEAARAGEAGLGFAVVADEVRNLAQRSSRAAKDTADLIEESINRSREGSERVAEVAAAIRSITTSVTAVTRIVDDVRESSAQQTSGIDQVSKALGQMEQVTQSTAATAEESAAASEELNAQAESSLHVVGELHVLVHGAGHGTGRGEQAAASVVRSRADVRRAA
ncbi:MAG: nitrate- and nitrite sensing domain-containing protein [Vicinamibacterales bacterium]